MQICFATITQIFNYLLSHKYALTIALQHAHSSVIVSVRNKLKTSKMCSTASKHDKTSGLLCTVKITPIQHNNKQPMAVTRSWPPAGQLHKQDIEPDQIELVFGLWSHFVSRSVQAGLEVSSLYVVVMINATLVNTHTHTHTDRETEKQLLTGFNISSDSWAKNGRSYMFSH